MDVCQLLWERPWKFDQSTIHDGYTNTYSLMKDGIFHKLKTLKEEEEKVCTDRRICLVNGMRQLVKEDDILMRLAVVWLAKRSKFIIEQGDI